MSLKPYLPPPTLRVITLLLAGTFCSLASHAQQPKVLAPHKHVAPRVARSKDLSPAMKSQSSVGGVWITSQYWKSQLYLKNILKTDPLTVTPVLYLSNGNPIPLAPVHLEPSGTAVVDINQGLAESGIASYASLSGYVEVQYTWPWDVVCATIRDVDQVHSLIFTYGLRPTPTPPAQNGATSQQLTQYLEGMWWKQESGVTGFLALSNITGTAVDATVEVLDERNNFLGKHAVTVSPHGTKTINLNELLSAPVPTGGVSLSYVGSPDALLANGGLEDEATGYSAHLPIGPLPAEKANVTVTSFAELGLMSGQADPMMSFPAGTVFTPYSVLRNIANQPVSVTPTLWWMQGGSPKSAQLPQFAVPPHRTQIMDLPAMLSEAGLKNFNGSVNLILESKGPIGGLAVASGSVDQKNTYVFEVTARSVAESVSKSLGYWSTGNGDDTMVTLWNPADEAQDLVFNLYFAGGEYHYHIPLGPRETRMFNVSEIIHAQAPDDQGKTIPPSIHEGSAEISGSRGENEAILVALDAGTYNVVKATCGNQCLTCNGFYQGFLEPNPYAVPVQGTSQQVFKIQYNTGTQYDESAYSNWSTSNTSVATVNNTTNKGLLTGVGMGTANDLSVTTEYTPVYVLLCTQPPLPSCPLGYGYPGASGTGTVQVPSFLKVVSITHDNTVCLGLGCAADIQYRVVDQNGNPISLAGMTIKESLSGTTTCSNGTIEDFGQWTTDSTGTLTSPDEIFFCCLTGSNCGLSLNQSFTVNGQPVLVMGQNGVTTGTKNAITISCTNGKPTCPNIVITP